MNETSELKEEMARLRESIDILTQTITNLNQETIADEVLRTARMPKDFKVPQQAQNQSEMSQRQFNHATLQESPDR